MSPSVSTSRPNVQRSNAKLKKNANFPRCADLQLAFAFAYADLGKIYGVFKALHARKG